MLIIIYKKKRKREKQLFNNSFVEFNWVKRSPKIPLVYLEEESWVGSHMKSLKMQTRSFRQSSLGSAFRLKHDLKARRYQTACHASVKPTESTHTHQTPKQSMLSWRSQWCVIEDFLDCYTCIVFSLVALSYLHIQHSHSFLFHFEVS